MKKKYGIALLLFAGLMAGGTLTSCSDDDSDDIETVITVNKLPLKAQTFISTYYPGLTTTKIERVVDNTILFYEVKFNNGQEVTFNAEGEWIEVDAPDGQTIPDGIVPSAIVDYLNENYNGYGVNEINRVSTGYQVELVSGVDMLFDSLGNFVGLD